MQTVGKSSIPVNQGKLLENQLKKWQGGANHPRGIAEYISNSDDSYRRLGKYFNQEIFVEIHCNSSRKIDKLIIRDNAEGMSFEDLENKFFQYFESFSGREAGEKVTGRFGTGGKAYAIMNFRNCWITSIKNEQECKAWFLWDHNNKEIIRAYDNGGYKNKPTKEPNGTTIELRSSITASQPIDEFIFHLEKLARIRHILKTQKIIYTLYRKGAKNEYVLKHNQPDSDSALRVWKFKPPPFLLNLTNVNSEDLIIRLFEKPIGENAFIDISDGVSSVADILIKDIDNRPSSNYINGDITLECLQFSDAVKENRRGLEEGDDLTEQINLFLKNSIACVIDEVEEIQKQLDKEKRINAANEKLKELSKFLNKQNFKFALDILDMNKKSFSENQDLDKPNEQGDLNGFKKAMEGILDQPLIQGEWSSAFNETQNNSNTNSLNENFNINDLGNEYAQASKTNKKESSANSKQKKGLQILFSNDASNPESPTFKEYDDPVSDRDMISKGIIWINAVHPIIIRYGTDKKNDAVRDENIANFVLLVVASYYAQKEVELQPADEQYDSLIIFRKHFFRLQLQLKEDTEISYFEKEQT